MFRATKRAKEIEYAIRDVVVPARELERRGIEVLKLNIGDPIKYDWETPEHVREAAAGAVMESRSEYSPSEGLPELREEIAAKHRRQGVDVDAENVVVTTGVTEALMLIFGAALEGGDEILVPGPTYPPYITYARFYGARPVSYRTVEEEGWVPDVDDIRRKIGPRTKCIAVINPNNPTGALYDGKTLREIMDLAGEHNLFVISDEIYDELIYEGEFISPPSLAPDVPAFLLNGISKVFFAPGWRIGYMALRDEEGVMADVWDAILKQARARLCPNTPLQVGYLAGLRGPRDFLREAIRKLRERRDYAARRINEIDGLSVVSPKGAFYMFPRVEGCEDDKKFVLDLLHTKHVLAVHGSGFCPTYGRGHFRIVNLPPVEYLERALDRVEEFMRERS